MNTGPDQPIATTASCIDQELIAIIRRFSADAEKLGQLHPEQLALMYRQRWFRIFVPRAFGGLEMTLPEGLRLLEALARADGSVGWVATLCGGANWFIGFLPGTLAASLFADERVCLAGSGRASGTAAETDGGYNVDGYWKYATGAPHATAFTANCFISRDGRIQTGEDGSPRVSAFLFLEKEVRLHRDWQSMGMTATASQGFSVSRLQLPYERKFNIGEQYAVLPQPVYRYPFLMFAQTTLSVNISGMAERFMELCSSLLEDRVKWNPDATGIYGEVLVKLESARLEFADLRNSLYRSVEESWNYCGASGAIPPVLQQEVMAACRQLTAFSRKQAGRFFPFCGMMAADPSTEINRVWRNLHTASLHTMLVDDIGDIPGDKL